MSRNSQAKKARRRKRQATRSAGRMPDGRPEEFAEIAEAAGEVNAWLVGRGWVLDEENATDDLVSWAYPPSAAEVSGECEPVTRIWMRLGEDDDAVTLEFGAVLVGADGEDGMSVLDPDRLAELVEELESYRVG